MNREIRFRAWTPDGMKHFDDLVLRDCGGFRHPRSYRIACNAEENTEYIHDDFAGDVLKEEYTLMQYTGIVDRNGKEICEGDIIRTKDSAVNVGFAVGHVVMNEGAWRIAGCYHKYYIHPWSYAMEVIGNIHENPELKP